MAESSVPSVPSTPSTPVTPATPAVQAKAPVTDPKAVTPPVAAKPAEDTWDVQENGKVVKKTRKEILEAYQLRQLSDRKRSEADKVLAEYKKLQEVSGKDPIKFMKAMGYDFDNLATSYLAKKAEDSMKDPKVLEAEKTKAELETYKKWVEEQKNLQTKTQHEQAVAAERSKIHAEIIQAIEESKELGMPVDEELVIAIAQKMMLQDKKQKPLNAKEALPAAYQSTQKWLQGMAAKMEGEAIVKWLGADVAKKIRQYDLAQLKAKRKVPENQALVKPQEQKKTQETPKYQTWSQFKANTLDKIK
jgi:hypothetical protein